MYGVYTCALCASAYYEKLLSLAPDCIWGMEVEQPHLCWLPHSTFPNTINCL